MNAAPRSASRFSPGLPLAGAVVAIWVWTCLCRFPVYDWNELRLAPSFMWTHGVSPYPGPGGGPVTTWIYGPVPILLQLPAVFAPGVASALLVAAGINLLVALVPLWLALRASVTPGTGHPALAWAMLLAVAAWPAASLIFCQADNAAVAFGLLAITALSREGADRPACLWLAAAAAALALWSKQTELGPLLGQVAFVGWRSGGRAGLRQLARCALSAGLAGLVFGGLFGAEGLIYNMFVVPGGIPWLDAETKLADPLYRVQALGCLLAYVVGPLLLLAWRRREIFHRASPCLLPALVFVASIPFNLTGFMTAGGSVNSLHGAVYLLPVAALWLATRTRLALPAVLAALAVQAAGQWPLLWRLDLDGPRQGQALARQLPGQVYFPWNPLPAFFADHRFDHAEDGLLTRALAGRPVPPAVLRQYLPPHLCVVAYHRFGTDGYVKDRLIPPDARRDAFGEWILYSWVPKPP